MKIDRITVRETIHHGDYRNIRTETIDQTWRGFTTMLNRSPYHAGKTNENWNDGNVYVARLFADLLTTGKGSLGWARYEVLS